MDSVRESIDASMVRRRSSAERRGRQLVRGRKLRVDRRCVRCPVIARNAPLSADGSGDGFRRGGNRNRNEKNDVS